MPGIPSASDIVAARTPIVCSWSGGKDSCFALYKAMKAGAEPRCLFTMLREDGARSRSHGLPVEVIKKQARLLGIPSMVRPASWTDYESVFISALRELKKDGIAAGVFGDIDIIENRAWEERVCSAAGMESYIPLWRQPRRRLLEDFISLGFRAMIVAVKDGTLGRRFLGKVLDIPLIAELEAAGVDASGENGEYHTVVTDGPIFSEPLNLRIGESALKDGCWFLDVDEP